MKKVPPPFKPDGAEGRKQLSALSSNTSFGDWRAVGPSNFGGKVYAVAVDPNNANNVYAAYEAGGLWGTHNAGRTWNLLYNSFENIAFSSVATHPTVSGLVAAGLIANGSGYFASQNQNVGLALSTDAGNTWKLIGPSNDPTLTVWEIGFGDSTGQVIYAPTNKGLYKTINQGTSWTKILSYDGSNAFFDGRPSFAVDPLNPNILLLADQQTGVMRSQNAGGAWTEVDNWVNPGNSGKSTLLSWSSKTSVVYAYAYTNTPGTLGTYRSTDEGATWTAGATTDSFNQGMYDMAIGVDPFNPQHVAIHGSNLQFTTDGFQTIGPDLGYVAGPDSLAVVFDPTAQGVVYDGNDRGVHKSADGGNTWAQFDVGVLTNKSVGGSPYALGSDSRIHENPADYVGQAFVPGYGWIIYPGGYEYNGFYANPRDPADLYVTGGALTRAPSALYPGGTIDPAPAEAAARAIPYYSLEFDPVDANTLYYGKQNLYKTTNRGVSWSKIQSGTGFQLVRVAPSNAQHVYSYSNGQVSYSTNGGASWTAGAFVGGVNMMAVSPADENSVYFASDLGMYKSTDGGNTAPSLPGFPSVGAAFVIFDPGTPANVFVSLAKSGGVLVSQDGGNNWRMLGTQLPRVGAQGIFGGAWMSIFNENLFLGTSAGVYEMNLRSTSVCSDVTFNPPSLTVPSLAGTFPLEVFIAGSCPLSVTGSPLWATVNTYEATAGHTIAYVTFTDNTANASLRTAQLQIDGNPFTITQLGGPDAVQNGNVVTISNNFGCVTEPSTYGSPQISACTSDNPRQQSQLQLLAGSASTYSIESKAAGSCLDSYGATTIGSQVLGYPCNFGDRQQFLLQPQPDGNWWIVNPQTLVCLNVASTGTTLAMCSASTELSISIYTAPSAPTISKTFSPTSIISGGSSTVTLTLANINASQLTGGAFTDNLANMSAQGGAVGGTCGGTAPATLTAGATALSFARITIPGGSSCTVIFAVTSTNMGPSPNTTSGVKTDQTAVGPASNTAILTVTPGAAAPTVVSYNLICGANCVYNMIGNKRVHLPWLITGVQVVFSEVITSANAGSLTGVTATGFTGLGTKTLTWKFGGAANANLDAALAKTGPNAISSAGGALTGTYTEEFLKILEGDFNDDGVVNASDQTLVNKARSAVYNIFADINGDGVVNTADVVVVRTQNGQTNP